MTLSYSAIIIITILTMTVLAYLIRVNGRLSREEKRRFYLICLSISLAAGAEWFAVLLDGGPMWTYQLHLLAKCLDYSFTPLCGLFFIRLLSNHRGIIRLTQVLLIVNTLVEIASMFTGWTFYLDGQNVHQHGPIYLVYVIVFMGEVVLILISFLEYGRHYDNRNRGPLFAICGLLGMSIFFQEYFGGQVRTDYLGMAIGTILLYIHYIEFARIDQERLLVQKETELTRDALTGTLSRFAYMKLLAEQTDAASLPEGLAAFEADLNGLKNVNDTQGHEAGDALLRTAGEVLLSVIGESGSVFRTGGDEFVILLDSRKLPAKQAEDMIRQEAQARTETALSFSIGWAAAAEFPQYDLLHLVNEADQRMYHDKVLYYSIPGHERRRRPTLTE